MAKRTNLGTNKDVEKIVRQVRREWGLDSVVITRGGHLKITAPNGDPYFTGMTSKGYSGVIISKIKKFLSSHGLEV